MGLTQIFDSLISTLGKIEVKGKENLDMLLGCILTLEDVRKLIKTEKHEVVAEEDNHDDQNQQG